MDAGGGKGPERPRIIQAVTASGTTRLMRGQLRYVREAGFEITLVASPGWAIDGVAAEEGVGKAPVAMARQIAPGRDVRSLWGLWRVVRRVRPALVNYGTVKAGLLMGIVCRLAHVPCRVYTVHGLRLETTRGLKRWVLVRAERIACGAAQRVICVSESVRRRVVELGLAREERTVVLGGGSFNGVDADRFAGTPERKAAAAALRRDLGLPPEARVIGFVGRFTRDKGMTELVEAFGTLRAQFPDLRLLLLGRFDRTDPVPAATRGFLESDPGVVQAGYVDDPAPYYQVMDVLALPTYREGFPTVALEAAAAGVPVVTTTATGAVDAVEDGVTGLAVPVGDAGALAEALERVLADRAVAQGMGRAGEARVRREFGQERIWGELAGLYGELLKERATHGRGPARGLKRVLDVGAALAGLVMTAPLLLLTAALIRVKMGAPVLFRHRRVGRDRQAFTLLKFRTMLPEEDAEGRVRPKAERITPAGRWLRRLSLDELPQFWNVLRGEMSLVGPRPLPPAYLSVYTERENLRHAVRPGLTGWAQVNGRGEVSFGTRFEMDAWYVEHWSLWLDLKIVVRTIPRLLRPGKSAEYQELARVDDRGLGEALRTNLSRKSIQGSSLQGK